MRVHARGVAYSVGFSQRAGGRLPPEWYSYVVSPTRRVMRDTVDEGLGVAVPGLGAPPAAVAPGDFLHGDDLHLGRVHAQGRRQVRDRGAHVGGPGHGVVLAEGVSSTAVSSALGGEVSSAHPARARLQATTATQVRTTLMGPSMPDMTKGPAVSPPLALPTASGWDQPITSS